MVTTNALRVLGWKAGLATFVCDILKRGCQLFVGQLDFSRTRVTCRVVWLCGYGFGGHDFPFYLKFKGGKGIAATIGMVLCVGFTASMPLMLISFAIGLAACCSIAIYFFGFYAVFCGNSHLWVYSGLPTEAAILTTGLTILALWQHRSNIGRLYAGNENKFSLKKDKKAEKGRFLS